MTGNKLSEQDVNRLLADPSGEARAEMAAKIAADFDAGELTESERKMAEDIFRLMVKDAEVRVREALSQNLKENPTVPHDVAMSLARDVDSVALPVLQFSEALSDEDLIEIVRSQAPSKQLAIAKRPKVSETVSTALVETENEEVVTSLVANVGAEISEDSLHKVVENFGDKEAVQGAMVHRPTLPVTVAERLVTMVSENMKEELARRHELPPDIATDLILQSRERATITLSGESTEDDLEKLIRQLIHDAGPLGLKAVFEKAGLPEAHFPAAQAAIDVARETEYDGGDRDRERYSRRMIERILTQYGDLGVDFDSDDLEYLLTKMDQLPPDTLGAA